MTSYQLLPSLTDDEYEALKADIAQRGVMVPVELDEAGDILDGHHRVRACEELGITDYPKVVRHFENADDLLAHVLGLNLRRRHLGADEKAALCRTLRNQYGWSVRQIAERTGFSKSAVGRYLAPEQPFVPGGTPDLSHLSPEVRKNIEEFRQILARQDDNRYLLAKICWDAADGIANNRDDFAAHTVEEFADDIGMELKDFRAFVAAWDIFGNDGSPSRAFRRYLDMHDAGIWGFHASGLFQTINDQWDDYRQPVVNEFMRRRIES